MSTALIYSIFLVAAALALLLYFEYQKRQRLHFINTYKWPPGLISKLSRHHSNLKTNDIEKIGLGLKQFFRAYLNGGRQYVAMPSQAADDLWHEFILYTRDYKRFCDQAFGKFLHHTPAVVLTKDRKQDNTGLRRVWWQTCKEEGINPLTAATLPLLFRLDKELGIAGGYRYEPDCKLLRDGGASGAQCGGEFSSTSYDGSTDGMGDSGSGSGDGSGDAGGGDGGCGGGGGD